MNESLNYLKDSERGTQKIYKRKEDKKKPTRKPPVKTHPERLKEKLKEFPDLFDLIDSKSIEINMLNSYKEQIIVSYKYFMEVFKEKNMRWKNVYLKELFQDKTKAIDDVLRYEKKNPNHSDHVGRSRIVNDTIMEELNNILKERNMYLKEVNEYFIKQGLDLSNKQTYGICKRIPNCTVGVRPLLEQKRCEVTKEIIKEYCEEVKLLMKNKNIPSSFIYNFDESGFDEGVDTKPTVMICSNDCSYPKVTPFTRESQRITFLGSICMDCAEVLPLLFITKRVSLEEGLLNKFHGIAMKEYQQSGFMNREIFIKWFKKFIEFNNMKKSYLIIKEQQLLLWIILLFIMILKLWNYVKRIN